MHHRLHQMKYQSWIGALQWCVTLGRFDIGIAVMTMSSFRAQPRAGHWVIIERIIGYLRFTKEGALRFRTDIPNYSHLPEPDYDWDHSVYKGIEEDIPSNAPIPKGKPVRMSTYVNSSLMHCRATGRSVDRISFRLAKKWSVLHRYYFGFWRYLAYLDWSGHPSDGT